MDEYTPSLEEVRTVWGLSVDIHRREERLAQFDRMINQERHNAWDIGVSAGLDTGLTIADNVYDNGGVLDIQKIPQPPTSPYLSKGLM